MTWNKHVFHILMKAWERHEVIMFAGNLWRSQKLDMNPSSTLWDVLPPFLPFYSSFFQEWYLVAYFLTESLLPAWGRSMHVLYSGAQFLPHISLSFPLSLFVSPLFLSLSCSFGAVLHSHTNKQWCLICRLFTFHYKDKISYDKLWYNVICFAIFCEPTV